MNLDVRLPLGLLFVVLGLILTIYGLTADTAGYVKHSLGENVNLHWGLIFLLFGAVVLFLARRKKA